MKKSARKTQPDWTAIDWSQTNIVIARTLNLSISTVWSQRQIHAPHTATMKGRCGRKAKHYNVDWTTLDWSLTNERLASQIGCSSIRVWRMRRTYSPHTATLKGRCGRKRASVAWAALNWTLRNHTLALLLGLSETTVRSYRLQHAPDELKHRKV